MKSVLGKEIKRFPLYKTDLFDKKGNVCIMEGGLVFESAEHKIDVLKDMIEDIKIVRELPFAKYLINLQYLNYMGSRINMSIIISEEDYNFLVSRMKR